MQNSKLSLLIGAFVLAAVLLGAWAFFQGQPQQPSEAELSAPQVDSALEGVGAGTTAEDIDSDLEALGNEDMFLGDLEEESQKLDQAAEGF